MKKIAILGCGQLGSIVADAVASGLLPDYTLCAAMSRKLPDAGALCAKAGGAACVTLDEVLAEKPDYVVETTAVQVAKESCLPVLEAGLGFIPISIGAFADADFYANACAAAKAHGGRIYLPHGASDQYALSTPVTTEERAPGDLVFFTGQASSTTNIYEVTHVGIYLGDGRFIHAANPSAGVKIDSLVGTYYGNRLFGYARYIVTQG